ncbi:hypothetical protein [Nonomuraea dietziae]|uniref:hypothetical protein n=1 Tax=Nonomuraea dietziae TaxID=65515 RepID=UPI0031D56F33
MRSFPPGAPCRESRGSNRTIASPAAGAPGDLAVEGHHRRAGRRPYDAVPILCPGIAALHARFGRALLRPATNGGPRACRPAPAVGVAGGPSDD